jgi:threonine synthase
MACGHDVSAKTYRVSCPLCDGPLDFRYPEDLQDDSRNGRSMWRYRDRLPVQPGTKIVTLDEGGTPLVRAEHETCFELFFKNETTNPTGSHKDRALSIGITKAREFGFLTCMLYSDGSAALSSAAYASRAGIRHIALVPKGVSDDRLLPLLVYNSLVLEFAGRAADALDWVHEACQFLGVYETSTYRRANPYESEGPKTISYEIFEELGEAPDWVVVPVGGGGTLAGIWRGFCDLHKRQFIRKLPRLVGVLPKGYRLLERGLSRGIETDEDLRNLAKFEPPGTIQVKIAMSWPPDGVEAIRALRASSGQFLFASDREAWQAQRTLGARDGIYAEVSAAVALVGVEKLRRQGSIANGEKVVAVITGSGFRETAELACHLSIKKIEVNRKTGLSRLKRLLKQ